MAQENNTSPLWCYTPLSHFVRPEEPAGEAARSGLRSFWKRVRRRVKAPLTVSVQAELRSVPQRLLDMVAPSPRWGGAGRAMSAVLDEWAASSAAEQPVKVIIGPSGTAIRHVVTNWAKEGNHRIVQAPSYQEIFRGSAEWMDQINGSDGLLVIPNLECFLLRHYNGLEEIRRLLEKMGASQGRFVIGCNSWAWAYLGRAVQIDALLPEPLTVAAFDGPRLQRWFHILAASGGGGALVFRQADDGSHVLPAVESRKPDSGGAEDEAEERFSEELEKVSPFIKRVAARSRGNPLAAWAIWRHCLNIARGEAAEEEAQEAAAADRGRTIWVRPWPQIGFPDLPERARTGELFLLHALLLHDGLPASVLDSLLPFSMPEIMQRLYRLRAAGLVKEEDGHWRVTLLGYPAVRSALAGEDYLTDGF